MQIITQVLSDRLNFLNNREVVPHFSRPLQISEVSLIKIRKLSLKLKVFLIYNTNLRAIKLGPSFSRVTVASEAELSTSPELIDFFMTSVICSTSRSIYKKPLALLVQKSPVNDVVKSSNC